MYKPKNVEETLTQLAQQHYVADQGLAMSVFLALSLGRPLLLEGEPGVGKTEIVKVLANILNTKLIRLQCYEGLDLAASVYEWDYARQMLEIRLLEAQHKAVDNVFSPKFLLKRPLLQALEGEPAPVLLIDEIDRTDDEFEAFLLEFLSEWQVTIPEIGTIKAQNPPVVVITSNRTRELHDALKRRCLYHWIDYPSFAKEYDIVRRKVPHIPEKLAGQIVAFIQELRQMNLYKAPGVAETLDWAMALLVLGARELTPNLTEETLGVVLKYQEDVQKVTSQVQELLARLQLQR